MALMRSDDGDRRRFEWTSDCFVGRGRLDGLSFDEADEAHRRVSQLHAAVTWNARNDRWEVRDLGSANGTFVDGARLSAAEPAALEVGTRLMFGGPTLTVVDVSPPPARAQCRPSSEVRVASEGILLLPDEAAPDVAIVESARGWARCAPEGALAAVPPDAPLVASGEVIEAGGRRWVIRLPLVAAKTAPSAGRLGNMTGVFETGESLDDLRVTLEEKGRQLELPPRKHHELLWHLAQARLADRAAHRAEEEQGWRTASELIELLKLRNRDPYAYFNLLVFRARQQLAEVGVSDHTEIIERRRGDQKLRLGMAEIRVVPGVPERR